MPRPTFELPPQYDPREVERRLYERWLERGVFRAQADSPKPPYVIVIPPPNVTGVLHMGHGLNDTIQDVLIRCARMRGREALWLPGTDHAGIATQNVVERQLAKEGLTRFDLGRERFVERVWAFVRETGSTILEQLKTIGCSCDWSRTRFTLDPAYTRAVREAFVRLWEAGLIYRGHRVIHWCSRCLTALSDEEAEFADETGKLYYIRYPRAREGADPVIVATTRPETMFGDVGLVYHPTDARYQGLAGETVTIPLTGQPIPLQASAAVDKSFGTGMLKVTPAHDAADFEIAKETWPRLAADSPDYPLVLTEDGRMAESTRVPRELWGMDRFEARKRIVKLLEAQGLLVKIADHPHAVRHCYRCDTVVEPRLSDQWFVKMEPLARPALEAFHAGKVKIVPERWAATYQNWMENIRDWNISRQLWWGHRIPVFTCPACGEQWADREDPKACRTCGGPVEQDPDVLDTWFSSWLWPFATLGWPEETPDVARFYPGTTLVTAPEILFFWVARMIMAGYQFRGDKPFTTVYLHGTARDTKHRRMSKSLGNGIDPLDVVRLFSADALRWTLIAGSSLGADVILDPDDLESTFAPGRNFANKLWNIGRFVLAQLPDKVTVTDQFDRATLTLADRWILSRLQATIRDVTASFEQFRLDEGAKQCFEFVWKELADWYVEAVKPRLALGPDEDPPAPAAQRAPAVAGGPSSGPTGKGTPPGAAGARWAAARGGAPAPGGAAQAVLTYCFDTALRLLHPVVPFITEELWQKLPGRKADELLAIARWPEVRPALVDAAAEREFTRIQAGITAARNIRAEYKVPPKVRTIFYINPASDEARQTFEAERDVIAVMSGSARAIIGPPPDAPGGSTVLPDGSTAFVQLEGFIDVSQECRRLSTERERLDQQLTGLAAKLSNQNFMARAPTEVVAREREKEREWRFQRDVLDGKLKSLGCS